MIGLIHGLWMLLLAAAPPPLVALSPPVLPASAALPDQAGLGPDLLTVSPSGAAAFYDPVTLQVRQLGSGAFGASQGASLASGPLEALAFAPDDTLLLWPSGQRQLLRRSASGALLQALPLPVVVPPDSQLRWADDGVTLQAIDLFGGAWALATWDGASLQPLPLQRQPGLAGAVVTTSPSGRAVVSVEGRALYTSDAPLSARRLGPGWVLVEALPRQGLSGVTRAAVSLQGAVVPLPAPGDHRYRPAQDVVEADDGSLAWMEWRGDDLLIRRVWP